jgi:hypothetical protein
VLSTTSVMFVGHRHRRLTARLRRGMSASPAANRTKTTTNAPSLIVGS